MNEETKEKKHKIFCFSNGGQPGLMTAVALGDDGTCLATHLCSHEGYMPHDLGMEGSDWKHKNYNEHFGEGNWELVWVEDARTPTPEFQAALDLNALQEPEATP